MEDNKQKLFDSHRQDCWFKNSCTVDSSKCAACVRFHEMKYLLNESGIPPAQQIPAILQPADMDVPAFERLNEIKENIKKYVENGNNLYITSNNTGNGKTSWAIKILLRYFNDVWSGNGFRVRGLFIHVPTFLVKLKNFNNPMPEEYLENVRNADLVIWDDIACSGLTNWEYTQLLSFIDYRIFSGKSNIYTSNVASEEKLSEAVGSRLGSRIYANSEVIELLGSDWRGMFDDK